MSLLDLLKYHLGSEGTAEILRREHHRREVERLMRERAEFQDALPAGYLLGSTRVLRVRTEIIKWGLGTLTVTEALEVC